MCIEIQYWIGWSIPFVIIIIQWWKNRKKPNITIQSLEYNQGLYLVFENKGGNEATNMEISFNNLHLSEERWERNLPRRIEVLYPLQKLVYLLGNVGQVSRKEIKGFDVVVEIKKRMWFDSNTTYHIDLEKYSHSLYKDPRDSESPIAEINNSLKIISMFFGRLDSDKLMKELGMKEIEIENKIKELENRIKMLESKEK